MGVDSGGARLAIRLLQDAAQRGELDPWDVDVIPVVDGFLDQLRQRIEVPRKVAEHLELHGGSYERDLIAVEKLNKLSISSVNKNTIPATLLPSKFLFPISLNDPLG